METQPNESTRSPAKPKPSAKSNGPRLFIFVKASGQYQRNGKVFRNTSNADTIDALEAKGIVREIPYDHGQGHYTTCEDLGV